MVATRAVMVAVSFVTVPLTLPYVGVHTYGLWMAVVAVAGMVAFADLGLSGGLMTKLGPCYAHGHLDQARRHISSAYAFLGTVALIGCGLLWLCSSVIPWSSLFNAGSEVPPGQARAIALLCLTASILNMPLSLINQVRYAYQQVSRTNAWQAMTVLAGLGLVLVVIKAGLPPLVVIAVSVSIPVAANLMNSLWYFGRVMPEIRPRLRAVAPEASRELMRLSGLFFVVTTVIGAATNADTLIISHALGPSSVPGYVIPARLLEQLGSLVLMINMPFWPANGDALAQGQLAWVRRMTRRMTILSVLAVLVPSVALVLGGERFFAAWLPVPLGGDRWLFAGLAFWWVLQATLWPRSMVQNAAGVVAPQLVGWIAFLALSVVTKWYGTEWFGVRALPWVGAVSYALTVAPAALYGYRRALHMHRVLVPASTNRVAGPVPEGESGAHLAG